jgi:YidC/Oxa1 family membrane protein insertase
VELVKSRASSRTDFPFAIEAQDAKLAGRLNRALYEVSARDERGVHIVEYRYTGDDGIGATKTFRIAQEYLIDFAVEVSPAVPYRIVIGPGIRTLTERERTTEGIFTGQGVVQRDGELDIVDRESGDRFHIFEGAEYVGLEDNYFLTVLRPSKGGPSVLRRINIQSGPKEVWKEMYAGVTAAGDGSVAGSAFFGPKETKLLDRYGLGEALQFGWFGVIARFLLEALVFINKYTLNYGFAIIVLTIIIKIVLYPLQHKSIVSMKKMQKVQPKMEAIKNKYKKARTDPEQRQKMNVEMMKLYQQEGINPMSGCIPILLQLPILWGFYGLLSRAIELRGAPWILWIKDLSEKDPTYILPILMTATMFIQTYITPSTGDPAQRRIFLMMPLIFGFVFKDFPSGLVLYWLVQNVLTIVQQMIMNKWWKQHPDELQKT